MELAQENDALIEDNKTTKRELRALSASYRLLEAEKTTMEKKLEEDVAELWNKLKIKDEYIAWFRKQCIDEIVANANKMKEEHQVALSLSIQRRNMKEH